MGKCSGMENTIDNSIKTSFSSELYRQFGWYDDTFVPPVQESSDEFFDKGFEFKLVSISENMNVLTKSESFFVTKVQVGPRNDIFIRISQSAISVILDKILGKTNKRFDLSSISDLEAKIITSFNDYLYEKISGNINKENLTKYPEEINLSYFVRNMSSDESARFVISIPKQMLNPLTLAEPENPLDDRIFKDALSEVNLHVGSTMFSVNDIKHISVGDIVVFENSNSHEMTLVCDNILQKFNLNPNEELIIPYDDNGGDEMDNSQNITNLWDSLQVEMSAEFDKIKISLGELKDIQEGLVVDISSVYNNKVALKVGNKIIAKGELVIINDRYGVKISNVTAEDIMAGAPVSIADAEPIGEAEPQKSAIINPDAPAEEQAQPAQGGAEGGGGDFDYSDFDIDADDL